MLNYLNQKKETLEAQRVESKIVYEDIEQKVEEYRKELYTERYAEVDKKNMLIDAQIAILDEVIEETAKAIAEAEAEADASVGAGEYEQKAVEY